MAHEIDECGLAAKKGNAFPLPMEIYKCGYSQMLTSTPMTDAAEAPPKVATKKLAELYINGEYCTEAMRKLPLDPTHRLVIQFRAAKKQVLWDVVLKAKASLDQLGPARVAAPQEGVAAEMVDAGVGQQ
eukprot:gene1031-3892_t